MSILIENRFFYENKILIVWSGAYFRWEGTKSLCFIDSNILNYLQIDTFTYIFFHFLSYLNNFDIQKTQFVWYQKFMKNVLNTNSHSFLKYICSKLLRILWKQHPIPIYIETSQFSDFFLRMYKKGIFDSEFEYFRFLHFIWISLNSWLNKRNNKEIYL